MALLNFDATQVVPSTGQMDPVPAGWYEAAIDESDMKPTKDGTGSYLQVRYSILNGQFVNHKVYQRLNLRNANQQAVEIAFRELSAICHATGVVQVADSSQLHGRPVRIKVKLKAADGQYEASNEIAAVKNMNEMVGDHGASTMQAPMGMAPMNAPMQQPAAQPAQQWQQPAAQQPWQQQAAAPAAVQQEQPAQQAWAGMQQQPTQQVQQAPAAQPGVAGMPPWAQG